VAEPSSTVPPDLPAELAARLPSRILFGSSSWTYPGWSGLVFHRRYPKTGASAPMLGEYARFPLFRTVGIDSSFYRPPDAATLEAYAAQLPPGFLCVSKVWDRLTIHTFAHGAEAGAENPGFLDADLFREAVYEPYAAHFAEHAGPFVFEFQTIARRSGVTAERFVDRLDRFLGALPRPGRYAVEIRNAEFLTPAYFAVLREHDVSHVFNSWTRMPPIGVQLDRPDAITAPFVVCRALLAPGVSNEQVAGRYEPYDRVREARPDVRADLVRLARLAIDRDLYAFVLINNRLEGSAPHTVIALAELLTGAAAG
jgi:uncharacterized protein YecE (DUF72 family)